MVTVIAGANQNDLALAGSTVGSVRAQFGHPLNIPAGAQAAVNGVAVADDYVLDDGDRLVFQPRTAEKGA